MRDPRDRHTDDHAADDVLATVSCQLESFGRNLRCRLAEQFVVLCGRGSNRMATAADESDTVVMSPATAHAARPVDSCSLVNPAPAGSQQRSATVELDKYDGSTALETHLAKLKNCANYYC